MMKAKKWLKEKEIENVTIHEGCHGPLKVSHVMEGYFLEESRNGKIIEDAIIEVDGFANWYMLRQGLTQDEIDKSIKEGVKRVEDLIKREKEKLNSGA